MRSSTASPARRSRRAQHAPGGTAHDHRRPPGLSTVLYGGGGAVAGAFLGYFTSQIVRSDWQTGAGRSAPPRRGLFLAGGAAVGLAGGILFDRFGPRSLGAGRARAPREADRSDAITNAELSGSDAANLLELVRLRRSHWLVKRGTHSVTRSPAGYGFSDGTPVVVPDDTPILVYLDNVRLGGPEHLRDLRPSQATRIEFLDAREATLRLGGGHTHGAIVVSTRLSDADR